MPPLSELSHWAQSQYAAHERSSCSVCHQVDKIDKNPCMFLRSDGERARSVRVTVWLRACASACGTCRHCHWFHDINDEALFQSYHIALNHVAQHRTAERRECMVALNAVLRSYPIAHKGFRLRRAPEPIRTHVSSSARAEHACMQGLLTGHRNIALWRCSTPIAVHVIRVRGISRCTESPFAESTALRKHSAQKLTARGISRAQCSA